jgi:hypothetical protein
MKKTIISIILLLSTQSSIDLNQLDKKRHMTVTSLIAFSINKYIYIEKDMKKIDRISSTLILANIPGVIKEIEDDKEKNNKFDKNDLVANLLGSIIGTSISEYSNIPFLLELSKERQKINFIFNF